MGGWHPKVNYGCGEPWRAPWHELLDPAHPVCYRCWGPIAGERSVALTGGLGELVFCSTECAEAYLMPPGQRALLLG
jgi:hypothetical protein